MVCYCLDMRSESKVGKFLSNKFVSIVAGVIQFLIWVTTLLNFIIQPGHVKEIIHNMDTVSITLSVLLTIVLVVFSGLLLYGLFKDRQNLINTYLIFNIVMTVLFIISFFINLFTQPTRFGWSGFMGTIFIILLQVLFFFIIRNYYLSFKDKQANRNPA